MTGMAKLLMIIGAIIFIIGFLMQFIHIGKLPGDIVVKKGNVNLLFSNYDFDYFKHCAFIPLFLFHWKVSLKFDSI